MERSVPVNFGDVDVSKVFTASSLRQMGCGAPTPLLLEVAKQARLQFRNPVATQLGEVLAWAHDLLWRERRSEYFYKNTLIKKIVFGKYSPNTISVFSEFRSGDCRADLLFTNGEIATVYEIKTDLDGLEKAKRQAAAYLACFTDVVFVVDQRHVRSALELLPEEVGVLTLTDRSVLRTVRSITRTQEFLDKNQIFNCLIRNEYVALASSLGVRDFDDYGSVVSALNSMSVDNLHKYFVQCLRARTSGRLIGFERNGIPDSLMAAACTYKLSRKEWLGIIHVLDTPLADVL